MNPLHRASLEVRSVAAMVRAGVLPLTAPHTLPGVVLAMKKFGPFGGAVRAGALHHGRFPAVADERGEISYADLDGQINRVANAWREQYRPGQTVGMLCRNHRGPIVAAMAASRAGLNTVWLNTGFSAPQAREVIAREGVDLLVVDADLAAAVEGIGLPILWTDVTRPADDLTDLADASSAAVPPAPEKPGRLVLLTSGTTGAPKGAPRTEPRGYTLPGSLLDRMPMRAREATVIGPPLFHGTGLIMTVLSFGLGAKVVLRRSFDPEAFLSDIATHRAATVCTVPVMLQRVLALPRETADRYDTSCLRVAFCSGAALPAAVSREFQDRFGDVLFNLYGSTEVSIATLATPAEVRRYPTSVGRPALGSRVVIVDDDGRPVPTGEKGRVFVGTVTPFEGYTGGGHKEIVDGLMATGDVGHFEDGRLHIDGRDDDMIVSGGENVFPAEVEELLVAHPAVREVAVVGVDDAEFGHRLRAFVAVHDGAELTVDGLKAHVRERLARYKVPRDVIFLSELPRNPTGKVLKRLLVGWKDSE
ncbi:MAG: AMP-binding protein [Aeromicrobium sp.]|uniref:AMP-binding protein n=1 Tax=Aeromicrobium sp. TaxID=1871063 RepID=UPI0039E5BA79